MQMEFNCSPEMNLTKSILKIMTPIAFQVVLKIQDIMKMSLMNDFNHMIREFDKTKKSICAVLRCCNTVGILVF